MSCSFTEKISSLIDGELSPAEAREVERHLVVCGQCAEARADFLSLRSQIAGVEPSLTTAVQNRALAKILSPRRRGDQRASALGVRWQWDWSSGVVALASIGIVALLMGLLALGLRIGFIPSKQSPQVALNTPAPASSPTPAPTVEPAKPATSDKQKQSEAPPRQPAPQHKPVVR